jgi:phage terminase Nu1 subunit (DNA packaging protein)
MKQIVDTQTLASWCGVSTRHIGQLAAEGILEKVGRGRFDLKQSIARYMGHLREQAAGRSDIASAAIQLKRANAKLAQLRYDKEAGKLIEVALLRQTWDPLVRGFMRFVMSIPGTAAFEIPVLTATDRGILERICRAGLEDCRLGHGFDFSGPELDEAIRQRDEGKDDPEE